MKNGLLFALSLLLIYSCNSDDGVDYTAQYEKKLQDEYDSFRKDGLVAQHFELVEECKEMSIADSQKDAFVAEYLEGKVLEVNDTSNIYLVSADKSVDENLLKFGHELKLKNAHRVIELPFDSLPGDFGTNSDGVYRFKEMNEDLMGEIRNNEFILIFRTSLKTMPKIHGDSFEPAIYVGHALLYNSKTKELVANIIVGATNSSTVEVLDSSQSENLESNFLDHVNSAYLTALQSKFIVRGYLPKLSNYYSY